MKGSSLHTEYRRLKVHRTRGVLLGFLFGTILGALVSKDFTTALLIGLLTMFIVGTYKSRAVNRMEKIIYLGGKK